MKVERIAFHPRFNATAVRVGRVELADRTDQRLEHPISVEIYVGVIEFDAADGGPVPRAFFAAIVNV